MHQIVLSFTDMSINIPNKLIPEEVHKCIEIDVHTQITNYRHIRHFLRPKSSHKYTSKYSKISIKRYIYIYA